MAFEVTIRQRPEGQLPQLVKSEMSNDTLQLKLIKDIEDVMAINGHALNLAQKQALRGIGTAWEIINAEGQGVNMLVTIRREGHMRKVLINVAGRGRFVDGHGAGVEVPKADPLSSPAWA
jgi:hypothetical protein